MIALVRRVEGFLHVGQPDFVHFTNRLHCLVTVHGLEGIRLPRRLQFREKARLEDLEAPLAERLAVR